MNTADPAPTDAPDSSPAAPPTPDSPSVSLDATVLEQLVGYNARRVAVAIGGLFFERMAAYGLRQADFSVLCLLAHNPGATASQLCARLDILPPNFTRLIGSLDRRGLITRRPHPHDGRAVGLYLTEAGQQLARETEAVVVQLEAEAVADLSGDEQAILLRLLRRLYPA